MNAIDEIKFAILKYGNIEFKCGTLYQKPNESPCFHCTDNFYEYDNKRNEQCKKIFTLIDKLAGGINEYTKG